MKNFSQSDPVPSEWESFGQDTARDNVENEFLDKRFDSFNFLTDTEMNLGGAGEE